MNSKRVKLGRWVAAFWAVMSLSAPPLVRAGIREADLRTAAMALMDAYASGQWSTVERYLTNGPLTVYGSDVSEFSTDRAGFKTMFENDQKLWQGRARFGPMSQVSSFLQSNIGSLFFTRVFELGNQTVSVRFSTVWSRESGTWRLVQLSNAVPTTGRSAAEILAKPHD